jgi:hypothetical protein
MTICRISVVIKSFFSGKGLIPMPMTGRRLRLMSLVIFDQHWSILFTLAPPVSSELPLG